MMQAASSIGLICGLVGAALAAGIETERSRVSAAASFTSDLPYNR
jgi:hypothetical protein